MRPIPPFVLLVLGCLAGAGAAGAQAGTLPAPPVLSYQAPPPEDLLEPGSLPRDAADPAEPPVLARPDARVFRYGEEVPRLTCLPYRACTLLLHPEETVLSIALGDSERWQVEDVSAPGTRPAIVLKPTEPNLLTNLVVKTDVRLYIVELLAPAASATDPRRDDTRFDALVAFSYPETWVRTVAEPPARPEPSLGDEVPSGTEPSRLHFGYRVERPWWPRHRLRWEPDVVYDDGSRTFIHLPAKALRGDPPAVLEVTPGGETAPLDARILGGTRDWLIVPTVSERLRLVTRHGDSTRQMTIRRTP